MNEKLHKDPHVPKKALVKDIKEENPDTCRLKVTTPAGEKPFEFQPGQCAMLSVPPRGEAIFSISSSPSAGDYLEFTIKKVGRVTEYLHELKAGDELGIRGPYGNSFPISELENNDLLFAGGGIGLAPLRSLVNTCLSEREKYGRIDIVYGACSPEEFIHVEDLQDNWPEFDDLDVHLTVDEECPGWDGRVGFVPECVKDLEITQQKKAVICGPPIMIKITADKLMNAGLEAGDIITTLEMKMKCGIGKCGRCNIGDKYVCRDGPVFDYSELSALPDEF